MVSFLRFFSVSHEKILQHNRQNMSSLHTYYKRQDTEGPLVGSPTDFKDNILPTQDVLRCFLWITYSHWALEKSQQY